MMESILSPVQIQAFGATHVGHVRTNNEDAWVSDLPHGIFLVADGMGGAEGGEIASDIAIKTAYKALQTKKPASIRINDAFVEANSAIRSTALAKPELRGMGTTLVSLVLEGEHAWISHCGDSRCYLLRSRALVCLTEDHGDTWHLWHVVGGEPVPFLNTRVMRVVPGDTFLLCSDGLTNAITEERIGDRLRAAKSAESMCRGLIRDALCAGGPDNVTTVVVKA
jgi:serine/threonine protein phosphatase PrpC